MPAFEVRQPIPESSHENAEWHHTHTPKGDRCKYCGAHKSWPMAGRICKERRLRRPSEIKDPR